MCSRKSVATSAEFLSTTPPDGWTFLWRDWKQGDMERTQTLWFVNPDGGEVLSPYSQIQSAEFIELVAISRGD